MPLRGRDPALRQSRIAPELDERAKVAALRSAASILASTIIKHLASSPSRDIALSRVDSALKAAEQGVAEADAAIPTC